MSIKTLRRNNIQDSEGNKHSLCYCSHQGRKAQNENISTQKLEVHLRHYKKKGYLRDMQCKGGKGATITT